jgi:hypothetical protein
VTKAELIRRVEELDKVADKATKEAKEILRSYDEEAYKTLFDRLHEKLSSTSSRYWDKMCFSTGSGGLSGYSCVLCNQAITRSDRYWSICPAGEGGFFSINHHMVYSPQVFSHEKCVPEYVRQTRRLELD